MQGLIRASARLLAMAAVMAAALVLAVAANVATTTALALGIVGAGVVGIVGITRRPRKPSAADEIAAMMAPPATAAPATHTEQLTAVEAMAPVEIREVDPEANMPRWRRPSLLEARRSDPTRQAAAASRAPIRFIEDQVDHDVRTVRYAVVPLLDRPDEVLGVRIADLESGDEVQVVSSQGTFLEIQCPNGDRGFVHRTTLRPRETPIPGFVGTESHEDALGALLSARGLTQS